MEALQRPALHGDHQPQAAARKRGGRPPRNVAHTDHPGEPVPAERGHRACEQRHSGQPLEPPPHARSGGGVARGHGRTHLPGDGRLHRRPRDHQDDVGRDQGGQRSVAGLPEPAGEDDGEQEGQDVAPHDCGGHAGGPARVGARQVR